MSPFVTGLIVAFWCQAVTFGIAFYFGRLYERITQEQDRARSYVLLEDGSKSELLLEDNVEP